MRDEDDCEDAEARRRLERVETSQTRQRDTLHELARVVGEIRTDVGWLKRATIGICGALMLGALAGIAWAVERVASQPAPQTLPSASR